MSVIDTISRLVKRDSGLGQRTLPSGVRLIGPSPEIAPNAWRHILFPGLSENDLCDIENKLHQKFPNDLRRFFRSYNGLSLYSEAINIWGKRLSWARIGREAWQPYDIVDHNNVTERPHGGPYSIVYFASTDFGKKRIFFDPTDHSIGTTQREGYAREFTWENFDTWLLAELHNHARKAS